MICNSQTSQERDWVDATTEQPEYGEFDVVTLHGPDMRTPEQKAESWAYAQELAKKFGGK